ncbi:efflux RND transporter permease subunit [Pararhodospirillum photometricum]|uniref:AcrB/AcrD/AcrF family cation efflux protein n=1 Tax=Pararhodospirillum photometricum DSM 122 TaxID=1150469 RepID=H6SRP6_PARPM|nr:efflux RND transporter permease subunit [Pararhodospirillum photometricum]CCG07575.1 AcrB/AcrD/AcrF family cation efflux protein [Pararhodospirillum photometricum DSM 122]
MKAGLSGTLTRAFIASPLTPLLLLAALAVGLLALAGLPREEEPQISVPMVDIHISADGLRAVDAVELVTKPLEDVVKGIDDVDHVYSQSVDDQVAVTARFKVGTDEDVAMLRVHETIRANYNRIPLGIPEPLIVGRGINDVPIVVLTLAGQGPHADRWTRNALTDLAQDLLPELMKDENIGLTFLIGDAPNQIRVEPDPERLATLGVTLNQLVEKVQNANRSFRVGSLREANSALPAAAGQTLQGVPDIGQLLITTQDGRPVYVADVARVVVGSTPEEHRLWQAHPVAGGQELDIRPAVSLAFAKRKGANAVVVAEALLERLDTLKGRLIPEGVAVEVTRNYGATAQDKADELLFHLGLATASIVLLVSLAIGWREGLVVALVIPCTILLTLFASWLMGYTLNRVSLFALIFSIGILVDDAIVVVENIARHWAMRDDRSVVDKAVDGVAEVGNPTIIATLTIVAALLPMMAVSGLMGPYMSPIPANASAAMVFSFFVAVVITPWLLLRLAGRRAASAAHAEAVDHEGRLGRFYRALARPVLASRARALTFLLLTGLATLAVCTLFYTRDVTVKLLPFDNKSEFQVIADLPEGTSLEETERVLRAAARRLADLPELTSVQLHAGTAAPFTFNGLVRHYYLREAPHMGDLQVNLVSRHDRTRASHAIALEARERLRSLPVPPGASLKVVEVPPGPPVLATLLAEIYGPDDASRQAALARVKAAFAAVPFVVDVDDMAGEKAPRLRYSLDSEALALHGVEEEAVYDTLAALIGGVSVGYSHQGQGARPVEIVVRLPPDALTPGERLLATPVPAASGTVELGDVVRVHKEESSRLIYRRDGHFVEMVMADLAGAVEAPIYGMLAVNKLLAEAPDPLPVALHGAPLDESRPSVLWDGEWEITYVTFRDMGAAFGVALLGIYLLVVGLFKSFKIPLLVLVPVPLTLIGIVLGHWAFGAPFSAPSMIGFIALAGIIVRNSILLVDFIRHARAHAGSLRDALLEAGAVRVKPIVLTALAAMIGGAFILGDPIFQGLALSLVFGLASSTALTLLVIPAIYVVLRDDGRPEGSPPGPKSGIAPANASR